MVSWFPFTGEPTLTRQNSDSEFRGTTASQEEAPSVSVAVRRRLHVPLRDTVGFLQFHHQKHDALLGLISSRYLRPTALTKIWRHAMTARRSSEQNRAAENTFHCTSLCIYMYISINLLCSCGKLTCIIL